MAQLHDVLTPPRKRLPGKVHLVGLLSLLIACLTAGRVSAEPADAQQLMQKALQAKAENYGKLKRLSGVTKISEFHPPVEFLNKRQDTDIEQGGQRARQTFLLDGDSLRVNQYGNTSPDEVWESFAHHEGVWKSYNANQGPMGRMVISQGTGVKYRHPFDPRNLGLNMSDDTLKSVLEDGELFATTVEKDGQLESFTLTVYKKYEEDEAVANVYTFSRENRFLLSQRTYIQYSDELPTPIPGRVVHTVVVTYRKAPDADALFPAGCVKTQFTYTPSQRWLNKTTWEIEDLRTVEGTDTEPFTKIEVPPGTEIEKEGGS